MRLGVFIVVYVVAVVDDVVVVVNDADVVVDVVTLSVLLLLASWAMMSFLPRNPGHTYVKRAHQLAGSPT